MVTPARSPSLFPQFVAQYSVEFDPSDPRGLAMQFPGIALPRSLESAVPKRQVEFAAGRFCTREALGRCAPELAGIPVGSGSNREPLWPVGIVGAITHTAGYASAAVARARDARGIGIDAERWMQSDTAAQIQAQIVEQRELGALARATGFEPSRALTLIFSVKESLFKCLFPEVKRYFDFLDAWVECVDPRGVLAVRLVRTLTHTLGAGSTFEARFEHDERLVYTGVLYPAS